MRCALIIFLYFPLINAAKLPSNFKKCNRKQTDFSKCTLEAAQDGISQLTKPFEEINTPSLRPLIIEKVHIRAGSGTVAVDQQFENCHSYGFDGMIVKKFAFHFDKKTVDFDVVIPDITFKCQYRLDGKVLLLPIQGEGKSVVTLRNVKAKSLFEYEELRRRGKTYFKFTSSSMDIDPDLLTFDFENLFNGDKVLGDNINKVLNDNWKEVFEDVKKDYVALVDSIILQLLNNFFSKVSVEEAFDFDS